MLRQKKFECVCSTIWFIASGSKITDDKSFRKARFSCSEDRFSFNEANSSWRYVYFSKLNLASSELDLVIVKLDLAASELDIVVVKLNLALLELDSVVVKLNLPLESGPSASYILCQLDLPLSCLTGIRILFSKGFFPNWNIEVILHYNFTKL